MQGHPGSDCSTTSITTCVHAPSSPQCAMRQLNLASASTYWMAGVIKCWPCILQNCCLCCAAKTSLVLGCTCTPACWACGKHLSCYAPAHPGCALPRHQRSKTSIPTITTPQPSSHPSVQPAARQHRVVRACCCCCCWPMHAACATSHPRGWHYLASAQQHASAHHPAWLHHLGQALVPARRYVVKAAAWLLMRRSLQGRACHHA